VNTNVEPATIAAPAANYAHAVVTTDPRRILHSAGVVPVRPDGTVPRGVAEQAGVVWQNLTAILAEAAMGTSDIVSMTTYVVAGEDLAAVMAARDAALGGHKAASTLVIVPALARPEWRVEVAIVAAS
jgi:enamine deaminase RidA (YjgF/YER057c/UK114 family)